VCALAAMPVGVAAQSEPTAYEPPPLGATSTPTALADLPASGNLLSLLEATLADLVGDRVDTGGLSNGEATRIGAHGSSWTQTTFRLGNLDITDPGGSGTPLLLPGVFEWDRVDVSTGVMPVAINGQGLAITLTPRRPAAQWTRSIELMGGPSALVGGTGTDRPPSLARLGSFASSHQLVSGPLVRDRVGAVFAGSWVRASRFERAQPAELQSSMASMFAHLTYTPTSADEARAVVWLQRARAPSATRVAFGQPTATKRDTAAHVQLAWDRRTGSGSLWTGYAGFTRRRRSPDLEPSSSIVVERLSEGPPPAILYPGSGTDTTWSLGARVQPRAIVRGRAIHLLQGGIEAGGDGVRARPAFAGTKGEHVNGLPARVWSYTEKSAP
jgi:hypothetical protein